MNGATDSGEIEYPGEGFTLRWNPDGLEIHVTEYHAEVLTVPWSTLLELARKAKGQASVE